MRTKFLLLLTTFFCLIFISNAQINNGRYLIGGSFNMYSAKNNQYPSDSKVRSLNSTIQFGKAIKEKTIVGLIVSYGFSNYYYPANFVDTSKSIQYTTGIFYRKYKKLGNKFYFFWEVDAEYTHTENTLTYNQTGTKSISVGGSASFVPGISYAIGKKMLIELVMPDIISLSYAHVKTYRKADPIAPSPTQKGNVFSFNTNLNSNLLSSFGIGFEFLLGK